METKAFSFTQQALLNRLELIFKAVFDDASFGYRPERSTKDAMRKIIGCENSRAMCEDGWGTSHLPLS
jgi:hypothetical protein